MYYVEPEPTSHQGEVMHLVARTAGAHRKYYYRRYEFGYWTPWEQIKLDIEDNPVIPVVWNGRLLLFWLRILKQAPMDVNPSTTASPSSGKKLTEVSLDDIQTDVKKSVNVSTLVTVQAVLCWSEFFNGKWQPTKTSDVAQPTTLASSAPNKFNRATLRLRTSVDGETLRIFIEHSLGSFLLYNTHSLPVPTEEDPPTQYALSVRQRAFVGNYQNDFAFEYADTGVDLRHSILKTQIPFEFITPGHELQDIWNAPLFFTDRRHVFLVTTQEHSVVLPKYANYGILDHTVMMNAAQIPPLVGQPASPPKPKVWGDGGSIRQKLEEVDPTSMQQFITEDAYIRRGLPITRNVQYGNRQIGPAGAISTGSAER